MLSLATKIFGTSNERLLKNYLRRIEPINALESKYEGMSNEELGSQTALFRERLAKVTAAELRAAARDFFQPDRLNLALVSPRKKAAGLAELMII